MIRTPMIAATLCTLLFTHSVSAEPEHYLTQMTEQNFHDICYSRPPPPTQQPVTQDEQTLKGDRVIVVGTRLEKEEFETKALDVEAIFPAHEPTLPPFYAISENGVNIALMDVLSGDVHDAEALLESFEEIRQLIIADYDCFRLTTGSPRLTIFTRNQLAPFRRASLKIYAEARLVHHDEVLAGKARASWFAFNQMMSSDPTGVFDLAAPFETETDPYWTDSQQFMEALIGDFLPPISTPDALSTLAYTDHAAEPWSYSIEELILTEILCSKAGQAELVKIGLACQLTDFEDHEPFYEIYNPALPSDYIGPKSIELSPLPNDLFAVEAVYLSARQAQIANWSRRSGFQKDIYCNGLKSVGPCEASAK